MLVSTVRLPVLALGMVAVLALATPVTAASFAQAVTPRVLAVDQPIVNNTVVVAEVVAEVDGWIVVHAFEADGKLIVSMVVGSTPIKAGTTRDVPVTLNESFKPGDSLVFMLHVDDGRSGSFDFPGGPDKAVILDNQVVLTQFRVLGDGPPVTIPDTGGRFGPIGVIALVAVIMVLNGLTLQRRSHNAAPVTRG